jgi:hypothetical protein
LATKDTVIHSVENAYANSINASNQALARYNLKITDSLHAVVSTLKLNAVHPQLFLAPVDQGKPPAFVASENGVSSLYIRLISKGGVCHHIELTCHLLATGTRDSLLASIPFSGGGSSLGENVESSRQVPLPRQALEERRILVLITGSFSSDYDGANKVPFNEAFEFNFRESKYLTGVDLDFQRFKRKLNIQ